MFSKVFIKINADVHWRVDEQVGGRVEGGSQAGHCSCQVSLNISDFVFGIFEWCIWYYWVGLFSNIVLTNTFCCRVYGDKTEQYIDRGAEVKLFHILCLWWKIHNNFWNQDSSWSFKSWKIFERLKYLLKVENMKLLESGGNGAKLYATFENGLAYEVPAKYI